MYRDSLVTAIHNLKFYDFPMLADYMGDCMAAAVRVDFADVAFDYVAAVPLGRRRRRKRGYNQAELLARRVAGALHIPYADLLEKVRNNPAQRKQNARSRRVNVYGAYAVIDDSALWDKTVLLIDDVKTTGATLNECAKMLRMHGAQGGICGNGGYCIVQIMRKRRGLPCGRPVRFALTICAGFDIVK